MPTSHNPYNITIDEIAEVYRRTEDYIFPRVSPFDMRRVYYVETTLIQDLRAGRRTLWFELTDTGKEDDYFYVHMPTREALFQGRDTYIFPLVLAVTSGMHPTEAAALDNALIASAPWNTIRSEELHILMVGDMDEFGAEDGITLSLLVPRSKDAPPDYATALLIERYGQDEDGNLKPAASPALYVKEVVAWDGEVWTIAVMPEVFDDLEKYKRLSSQWP